MYEQFSCFIIVNNINIWFISTAITTTNFVIINYIMTNVIKKTADESRCGSAWIQLVRAVCSFQFLWESLSHLTLWERPKAFPEHLRSLYCCCLWSGPLPRSPPVMDGRRVASAGCPTTRKHPNIPNNTTRFLGLSEALYMWASVHA